MALLNRLFSSRKKQPAQRGYVPPPVTTFNQNQFNFSRDQVRVLLFRECERRGRKLLFDSKAVRKVSLSTASKHVKLNKSEEGRRMGTSFVEITNGVGYQYTRPTADVKSLGEMIFGSVAMTLCGSTFKVHTGGTPPFLMFTRVTNSPGKKVSDYNLEDSCGSSISSMNEYAANPNSSSDSKLCYNSSSYPLDVPLPSSLTLGASQFFLHQDTETNKTDNSNVRPLGSLEGDSGCYASSDCSVSGLLTFGSFNTTVASPDSRKGSGGSLSSLRRRWLRTASTSLDLGSSQSLIKTESCISSSSLQPSGDDRVPRHTKLGIALIINLTIHQKKNMQDFILEHGMLLESITARLQAAVERAYCHKELFVSMMVDASGDVEQSIEDLIIGPRLPGPVWLSMTSSDVQSQPHFASKFLQDMCQMIDSFDTKDTNFFLSTLLTAVLTHHLGWVPTVVPGIQLPFAHFGKTGQESVSKLSELNKIHPYNPLWAQAMDLYGALGHPLKTARTIITSLSLNKSRHEIIEKLLCVMSYFIRCASIENSEPRLEDTNFLSCLPLNLQDNSNSLFVDDNRAASSSTLRPPSCDFSGFQKTPPNDTNAKKRSIVLDISSSKSENALDSAKHERSDLKRDSKLCERGLRRTMSYSSRLSSSVNIHVPNNSCFQPQLSHYDASESLSPQLEIGHQQSETHSNDKEEPTPVGKVIFVLGENENLIGLKRNRNNQKNESNLSGQNGVGCGKVQEQPLSFSGSEVESGFSDCESFELSPVRSISENILCPLNEETKLIHYGDQKYSKVVHSNIKNNMKGFESCSSSISGVKQNSQPSLVSSKIVTVHAAYIKVKNECKSSLNVKKLRSLARSISVNLPISFKSPEEDYKTALTCVKCNRHESESYNFKSSSKRCIGQSHPKELKKLSRTHSSVNVSLNDQNSVAHTHLCRSCVDKETNPYLSNEDIPEHRESLSSVHLGNTSCSHSPLEKSKTDRSVDVVELPLPLSASQNNGAEWDRSWGVAGSLFGGVASHYIPERVLQGCAPVSPGWELTLKRDLALDAQRPILDSGIAESVAIVANIDSWDVQLISSHTYVVDRPGTLGVRMGLSQLVANMLESVYHLWKLHSSPELCLSYLEGRLREVWARSRAVSELLLSTEFCDMDLLTSSLCLEANDVPLLLAVASTHSPQVTQRYGLSFR